MTLWWYEAIWISIDSYSSSTQSKRLSKSVLLLLAKSILLLTASHMTILVVGILTLVGIIASIPYAKANGVAPMAFRLVIR